jgi:ABC-2 type transport system ATP-binding protein
MTGNGAVIRVDHATKRFSGHTAVDQLSMSVPGGGIFGLLGPNGAGKSTTIRMIMNIITPDEGRITVLGREAASRDLSNRIGFLPEERGLYKKMKVLDVLTFLAETKAISRGIGRRMAGAWLDRLGLSDWKAKKVEDLSKGMQQKVQFIGALLHDPELLILDEPFSGLDPVNSQVMKDVVVEAAQKGKTVLFSTHIMEQAEKMCDHIVIISRGRVVVEGSLSKVKREFGGRHIALSFTRNKDRAAPVLNDRTQIQKLDDYGATAELELAEGGDPDRLLRALIQQDVGLSRFEIVEPSLQAIFVSKVGAEAAVAPAQENPHA